MTLTDQQRNTLDHDGFIHVPALLPADLVAALRARIEALWQEEGAEAGHENYAEAGARRLANLAAKDDLFRSLWAHPLALAAARHVMGPQVRLSMLNARDALPQQAGGTRQKFHADTDGGGMPDDAGYWSCTAIWPLDPFTVQSGATRIIPGSHRSDQRAKEVLADRRAAHPDEVLMLGAPGDLMLFNGHCWHAGGPNLTAAPRRAILAHYLRADIPRGGDRRQHLDAGAWEALSPAERELLGLEM